MSEERGTAVYLKNEGAGVVHGVGSETVGWKGRLQLNGWGECVCVAA